MPKKSILAEKIKSAKLNDDELNILVSEYKPFIVSEIEKFRGKYIFQNDEFITSGMMAFAEAVKSYKEEKGSFIPFARKVIKLRLIDFYKKEYRYKKKEYLTAQEDDDVEEIYNDKSLDLYITSKETEIRKEEIQEFKKKLEKYGITLSEREKISPKREHLKQISYKSALYINEDNMLLEGFLKSGKIPITAISNSLNVNRKKIERGRKYIIALLIIINGDFEYIKSYISLE